MRTYNATAGIGGLCFGIAYNAAKESIFVANGLNNTVSILSTSSNPSSVQTQTPTPTTNMSPWDYILYVIPLIAVIVLVTVILLLYRRHRKPHP